MNKAQQLLELLDISEVKKSKIKWKKNMDGWYYEWTVDRKVEDIKGRSGKKIKVKSEFNILLTPKKEWDRERPWAILFSDDTDYDKQGGSYFNRIEKNEPILSGLLLKDAKEYAKKFIEQEDWKSYE
jgi:hypothetical protein